MTRAFIVLTALGLAGPALAQTALAPQNAPAVPPAVPVVRTAPDAPLGSQPGTVVTRTAPVAMPKVDVQPASPPPAAVMGGAATSATQ